MDIEQPYDEFMNLYARVRTLFLDDPEEIIGSQTSTPEREQVVRDLYEMTHKFRMNEAFSGRRKIVEYVPGAFSETSSDYLKRWSSFVDYYIDDKNWVDDFLRPMPPQIYSDNLLPPGDTRFKLPVHEPDPDEGAEFDPLIHDGRKIAEWIEGYLLDRTVDDPARANEASNSCGIAYDYMQFMRNDLRMDYAGIERRWRMVPLFLRPTHVVEHDVESGFSLYGDLDNAINAFMFDEPKAALALCRATLELVLRQFYAPQQPERAPLQDVIRAACADHDLIMQNKDAVFRFKEAADSALHRPGNLRSATVERVIVQFMELLSVLIQRAPNQPGRA